MQPRGPPRAPGLEIEAPEALKITPCLCLRYVYCYYCCGGGVVIVIIVVAVGVAVAVVVSGGDDVVGGGCWEKCS